MSVLVTGATGAIGAQVMRLLVSQGRSVVGFDIRPDFHLLEDARNEIAAETGDVRDWGQVLRVLKMYEVRQIVHLAAILPDQAQTNPRLAFEVNVQALVNLCELARWLQIGRLVFASSKGVYRPFVGEYGHPEYKAIEEGYPIGPTNVYGTTKYAAERMGLEYASMGAVDFVALRFSSTYGPGRMSRHGVHAIRSAIIEKAFHGEKFELERGGSQQDDFVYVKDVAQAVVKALTTNRLTHRVFNIGSGRKGSLADIAEILRGRIPKSELHVGPGTDYGSTGRYGVFDISLAREELGYEPLFDLEAGIDDYLEFLSRSTGQGGTGVV